MSAADLILLGCGLWGLIVVVCYWWLLDDIKRDPLQGHRG
ncbi:hypothetical protein MAUB1S_10124 [Mycolicibacterium aubagnense]